MVMTAMIRIAIVFVISQCLFLSLVDGQDCKNDGTCIDEENICQDLDEHCLAYTNAGECDMNPRYMFEFCPMSCGVCFGPYRQYLGADDTQKDRVLERLKRTKAYVETFTANETFRAVWDACQSSLTEVRCTLWAEDGECTTNPSYMKLKCSASCETCELMDMSVRCPDERRTPNVWGPGDLHQFFVNLTTNVNHKYENIHIVSQPPHGPWVVSIDDFFTNEEANRLIELGHEQGYQRSMGTGEIRPDGTAVDFVSQSRTSSNTWCQQTCADDPVAIMLGNRIANMTRVPLENHEHLQLLHYKVGQYYWPHHDYILHHMERLPGPRILTVFLYLNDVEEGGGTRFPLLDLTVSPKVGRALIWPSVLDENPTLIDERTNHEALPVEKGEKFSANAWIHLRDYKWAHANSCQ